jgi:hypothetical protein
LVAKPNNEVALFQKIMKNAHNLQIRVEIASENDYPYSYEKQWRDSRVAKGGGL